MHGLLLAFLIPMSTEGSAIGNEWLVESSSYRANEISTAVAPSKADSAPSAATYVDYAWTYQCQTVYPGPPVSPDCGLNYSCPDPADVLWRLWGQRADETWLGLNVRSCFDEDEDPAAPTAAAAVITPAMVLNEIRRIGLPNPTLTTEPPGSTLVNLETRFTTTDESFTAEVTLLGRPVSLRATPTRYVVDHGDGTSGSTSDTASSRSQSDTEDVLVHTHTYASSGAVSPQVTTTWSASFSVAGGPLTQIDETITVTSPATELDVRSSTPLLTGG